MNAEACDYSDLLTAVAALCEALKLGADAGAVRKSVVFAEVVERVAALRQGMRPHPLLDACLHHLGENEEELRMLRGVITRCFSVLHQPPARTITLYYATDDAFFAAATVVNMVRALHSRRPDGDGGGDLASVPAFTAKEGL